MSSRKNDMTCFICDFWWLILLILAIVIGGIVFTRDLWEPELFPHLTTTPFPTNMPTRVLTNTAVSMITAEVMNTSEYSLGTGDIQITLRWEGYNDLDLIVADPFGEEISYSHKVSGSQGNLDIDSNAGCNRNINNQPVENIFWPTNNAPDGTYKILVNYYAQCGNEQLDTPYSIRLLVDGEVEEFTGIISVVHASDLVEEFTR